MKKLLGVVLLYIILAVLLLPLLVTALCGGFRRELPQQAKALYGLADLAPLDSELEEYVAGVVAAEMPAAFPEEALKAQAVAARTYQVRQMQAAGSDAVLYDVGQAYITPEEQKQKWGENYAFYAGKIRNAVRATAGEIMVYEGEPILAAFHAQSAGKTEDAENVWNSSVPYLKSVDSSGDRNAPDNETTVTFSVKEISEKLGCEAKEISVLGRTDAGYVTEVRAGGKVFTGRELREVLGLRSTNFTVEKKGDMFLFTVLGYGHGAGMSQYGAAFFAEEGMEYHEILRHYYTDIDFRKIA
ncbi:stage II sporulation protein D [Anaerotignum sp.]